MRARIFAVAILVGSGCAHHAAPPPHAEAATHRPISLPHHLVDGHSGQRIDDRVFDQRLIAARAIYVGEEHPNPHHHAVELEVLERVHQIDAAVALGVEMLPVPLQPALDQYLRGLLDEDGLARAVNWPKTWGYDFGYYAPLFAFCKSHSLRAHALNAPRALAHAVAEHGLSGLSPAERAMLPEIVPGPEPHRALVREAFSAHPHGGDFERFYAAQLVWDETMASQVAAVLGARNAPHRIVVAAGEGHVHPLAIPDRAARRGAAPYLTIVPVYEAEVERAVKEAGAGVLWVLEKAP